MTSTGDVALLCEEGGDLLGEAAGTVPVVVVPVSDEIARAISQARLRLAPRSCDWETGVANSGRTLEEIADGIGAVVDDDEFFPGIALSLKTGEGEVDEAAAIVGGHDAGDERELWGQAEGAGQVRLA